MMASSYNAKDEDGHITVSGPGGGALRSKKPENTAFKQQRLPAWQPILTAGTVLPAFFIIGLIFIPIGIGLYVTSNNIKEFEVTLMSRAQRTGTTPGLTIFSVTEGIPRVAGLSTHSAPTKLPTNTVQFHVNDFSCAV